MVVVVAVAAVAVVVTVMVVIIAFMTHPGVANSALAAAMNPMEPSTRGESASATMESLRAADPDGGVGGFSSNCEIWPR